MKFSDDPKELLLQARALHRIVKCVEAQLSYYRNKDYACSEKRLAELESQIQSERTMNDILTRELESSTGHP